MHDLSLSLCCTTAHTAPQVLIIGGTGINAATVSGRYSYYLAWDPNSPVRFTKIPFDPVFANDLLGPQNTTLVYYPRTYVLPDSNLFIWADVMGGVMEPLTGRFLWVMPRLPASVGNMRTEYPYTSSIIMRDVTPDDGYTTFEMIIFGGAKGNAGTLTTALDFSLRWVDYGCSGASARGRCGAAGRRCALGGSVGGERGPHLHLVVVCTALC